MDLGSILGGLDQAIDIYGKVQTIRNQDGNDTQLPPGYRATQRQAFNPTSGGILDFFMDEDSGQVVIKEKPKRRRRRRRLATASDLRDLAALKSILGQGEVFKAWVATRRY